MSVYDKLMNRFSIKPVTVQSVASVDGVDFELRQNYATLANTVELITEVIMDIAKRTDGISLDMAGSRLRRNDVASSVARSLETQIQVHLGGEDAQ